MDEELVSRPYQVQLEEISAQKNTIIHLPTGSGKTFIAICLIKRFREALRLPWGAGGKRTFFLVNTVPLVIQQKKVIEALCPVNGVGAYSGEGGVDYWDQAKWDSELEKNQVIVMTSQILCNMLTHSYIHIDQINLLIFDECHHAVDDHPMRTIMKYFEDCPVEDQPRVVGLTATLLNANVTIHLVQNTLKELETTFHATIATVDELGEVLTYSTNPFECVLYHNTSPPSPSVAAVIKDLEKLRDMVLSVKLPTPRPQYDFKLKAGQHDITVDGYKIVKEVRNMIVSIMDLMEDLGVYGGALGILAYIILLERLKRKTACEQTDLLFRFTITHLTAARMMLLKTMENETGYDKILQHSSAKFLQLLNILREYNPKVYEDPGALLKVNLNKKPLCAIIFTRQRFTAKVLYNVLKAVKEENPEEFDFLKHDFIVGFGINPFKVTREQYYLKKSSHQALLKFGRSELNCIISTSVIEEGVDIPQCLLVLRYDPPLEYRSYIQSKGRARSKDASYVMLVNSRDKTKFMKSFTDYQRIESYIQRLLVGSTDDRDAPTLDDIQENLYDSDDMPPFVTPLGARLTSVMAISLLNRYFSTLPHDQFTTIRAAWLEEKMMIKDVPHKIVTIILPLACPYKPVIQGEPFVTLKSAKRSAALEACKHLYGAGELDAATLLPRSYHTVDFDEAAVRACFPCWPWDGDDQATRPGTKKNVRRHRIAFPRCLKSVPGSNKYYLHIINLTAAFPEPAESREKALYRFIESREGYGLLTQQPLAKVCDFPSFVTSGEVKTRINMNYAVIALNESLFELVKRFHWFIFDQVLAVAKKFVTFEGRENCIYVVPVTDNNGFDINWEVMQRFDSIPPVETPDIAERKNLHVNHEDYQYSVVTPWYRGGILPDRYIVSNVLEHMTPRSLFESESYLTFADYYSSKYHLDVLGPQDQPLLEVRNISSKMNCLLPRAATIKLFTDKQKRQIGAAQGDDKPSGYAEIFIPEFCIKYDYPGVLWYKAMMLPTILHRIHMLLVAQELMMDISRDTAYGTGVLPKTEEWLPIEVDMTIAVKSLLANIEENDSLASQAIDRINNPSGSDKAMPNISSMKDSLYTLQTKKLAQEYPWDEKQEPVDIERNISTVTVMDIQCYDQFVSAEMGDRGPPAPAPAPRRAAIKPASLKCINKIALLDKQPIGRGPELRDVTAALTTIKSQDAFCLERAETLGDSFLKFAVSLYLFHKFPNKNEGQLTNIKCRLISNRNLYYAGERINLGGRMKIDHFGPKKDCMVPGFFAPKIVEDFIKQKQIRPTFLIGTQFSPDEVLNGEIYPDSWEALEKKFKDDDGSAEREPPGQAQNAMQCYVHSQAVSDKSVADCVEALIGTYLLSGGVIAAVKLTEWLHIIPEQDNFEALLHKRVPTVISEGKATSDEIKFLMNGFQPDIEKILNYKFRDPALLLEAISHASYLRNRQTRSYERLEFLGDAILDFLITSHIYERNPALAPGDLTDLRSALVNNVTFAAYVVKLGLHKYICKELNPVLDRAIMQFVEHQVTRNHEIVEDVLYLIDEEECQLAEYVEVPKTLSDMFEALTGAIYLDSGGSLGAVWAVVHAVMCAEIQAFSARIPRQPVAVLHECIHTCPAFGQARVIDPDIPRIMVPVSFTKGEHSHTVYGVGNNKAQAKRAAAKLALKIIAS